MVDTGMAGVEYDGINSWGGGNSLLSVLRSFHDILRSLSFVECDTMVACVTLSADVALILVIGMLFTWLSRRDDFALRVSTDACKAS